MRRPFHLVIAAVVAGCSTSPSSSPSAVPCYAAKNGDPCDGSESSCRDACSSITPVRLAQCVDGRWSVSTLICEPPPKPMEAGVVDPPPPRPNETVGKPCADDAQCDPEETGLAFCSAAAFVLGPIYPTNVCFEVECDGEGTVCGGGGVCVSRMCLPKCTYDATGPTGCLAKTSCFAVPKSPGIGYCFGGCRTDEDCAGVGAVCQQENGWCVKKRVAFTKSLGSTCTASDDGKACACRYDATTKLGHCSQVCRIGEECPTGWVCDAGLPEGAPPNGLAGWCAKTCTTDDECDALNARCVTGVCRVASPAL